MTHFAAIYDSLNGKNGRPLSNLVPLNGWPLNETVIFNLRPFQLTAMTHLKDICMTHFVAIYDSLNDKNGLSQSNFVVFNGWPLNETVIFNRWLFQLTAMTHSTDICMTHFAAIYDSLNGHNGRLQSDFVLLNGWPLNENVIFNLWQFQLPAT